MANKFALFSDLHLHNWASSRNIYPPYYRLSRQRDTACKVAEYCKANGIEIAVFCGDFFHTHGRVTADVMLAAKLIMSTFEQHKIHLYMIDGNHDLYRKQESLLRTFHSKNAYVFSHPAPMHVRGKWLSFMPYSDEFEVQTPTADFMFIHQGVQGVPMGSGYLINEPLSPDMIPRQAKAFTGHYHTHNQVSDNLTVVGSLMQHNQSDTGEEKGFLVVDFETGEYERVILDCYKFITMSGSFAEMAKKLNTEGLKKEVAGNFIRIVGKVGEKYDEIIEFLTHNGAAAIEVQYEREDDNKIVQNINHKGFDLDIVLREYFEKKGYDRNTLGLVDDIIRDTYEVPIS